MVAIHLELSSTSDQVLFEDFGFDSVLCRPSPWFSAYEHFHRKGETSSEVKQAAPSSNSKKQKLVDFQATQSSFCMGPSGSCIVVDSGFSFTHILSFVDGKCVKHAVRKYGW